MICLQLWITLNSQSSSLVFLGMRDGGHQNRGEGKSEELGEKRPYYSKISFSSFAGVCLTPHLSCSSLLAVALHFAPELLSYSGEMG